MNARPFRFHKTLGEGGFGEVWQVELLIPRGTELVRTDTGHLKVNGGGFAVVRPLAPTVLASRSFGSQGPWEPEDVGSEPPAAVRGQAAVGVPANANPRGEGDPLQAREEPLVQEPPATGDAGAGAAEMLLVSNTAVAGGASQQNMRPPQDFISFVLDDAEADGRTTHNSILRSIGANEDRTFNIEDSALVFHPSGAFFALKLQKAKNSEQLAEFAKEAENMGKLKGCPFIIQIVDHAVIEHSLLLFILMELGACDLDFFLRKCNPLSMADTCRIWRALVRAVDAAHAQDIIHRDIKPQNFVLVPETPFAERVLATTAVPREKFVLQVADDDEQHFLAENGYRTALAKEHGGDVKLSLRDPTTGREEVLRLRLKLSDFGMAQPLEIDASHLSIKGCSGTILYMAPETLRPTVGTKKVSKQVDIWALGVILFQMLHDNRTPFGAYYAADGRIGVAVAASHKEIHREAMVFERTKVWIAERKKVLTRTTNELESRKVKTLARNRALLHAWMQTEFLFRMCQFCLSFDALDRVAAEDLVRWVGVAVASGWWTGAMWAADGKPSMDFVEQHIAPGIVGRIIAEEALPEVFRRKLPNAVDEDGGSTGGGKNGANRRKRVWVLSLEDGEQQRAGTTREMHWFWSARYRVFGLFLLLLIVGVSFFLAMSLGGARVGKVEEAHPVAPQEQTVVPVVPAPQPQSTDPGGSPPVLDSSSLQPRKGPAAFLSPGRPLASPDTASLPTAPAVTPHPQASTAEHPTPTHQDQPKLQHTPPSLSQEQAIAKVMANGLDLRDIAGGYFGNNYKQVVLAAVKNDGYALQYASNAMKADEDVVAEAVMQNVRALQFALTSGEHRKMVLRAHKEREKWRGWIHENGLLLRGAPDSLKTDKDTVLAAVQQNGLALGFVPDFLKADKEIGLAAVEQNGLALEHADVSSRTDRGVVLAAVTSRASALKYALNWRMDREIVKQALRTFISRSSKHCTKNDSDVCKNLRADSTLSLRKHPLHNWRVTLADDPGGVGISPPNRFSFSLQDLGFSPGSIYIPWSTSEAAKKWARVLWKSLGSFVRVSVEADGYMLAIHVDFDLQRLLATSGEEEDTADVDLQRWEGSF